MLQIIKQMLLTQRDMSQLVLFMGCCIKLLEAHMIVMNQTFVVR